MKAEKQKNLSSAQHSVSGEWLASRAREKTGRKKQLLVYSILLLPFCLYLFSLWTVRPFSVGGGLTLSFAVPVLFLLSPFIVSVPRRHVLDSVRALRLEFILLGLIFLLAILSLMNSNAPFRSFRVIFPCLLPAMLLVQLALGGHVFGRHLLKVPVLMIVSGLFLSVAPTVGSAFFPPIQKFIQVSYRVQGFFENSIQHGIALSTLLPLAVSEFTLAEGKKKKAIWCGIVFVLAYTMFRAGAKSPMFLSFAASTLLYIVINLRSGNAARIIKMVITLGILAAGLSIFGLTLAEKINPVIAGKINNIFEEGVTNYQSVDSRKLLWREAIEEGKAHWLIGSGAGETVRGLSHAHNLIIDYFKGTGFFGATAIALLCLTILFRTVRKGFTFLAWQGDEDDQRILACFVSASVYVVCNQLSDCFGPSTVGFLWTIYLTGVLADTYHRGGRREVGIRSSGIA